MDLHIDHLDCQYRTPVSSEEASTVRKRLDRIASNFLACVWDENAGYEASDKIYFAEHIEVDLTLDASNEDDHRIARTWASELHKGVTQTLRYGGRGIIVFSNRVDFLANFLGDLMRGNAWGKWYYREFSGLASKSLSQAVSAVLTSDPDTGRDTLIQLAHRGDLTLLLATLSSQDLDLIVAECLLPDSPRFVLPATYVRWTGELRRLLATGSSLLAGTRSRDLAGLYLALLVESPSLGPDVNLARFISELLDLRQVLLNSKDRGLLQLVALEDWGRAFAGIKNAGLRRFATELARDLGGPQLAGLLRELRTMGPDTPTRKITSNYGGLFLLAPAALTLGLDKFLNDSPYPEPGGATAVGLLFYLIGLQCLGSKNASQVGRDGALPLFAGLAVTPERAHLDRYAGTLTSEMHEQFQSSFRDHLADVMKRCVGVSTSEEVVEESSWFSLPFDGALGTWSQTLQPVSEALVRFFASTLGAFSRSSPAYLDRNFLECKAEIEVSDDHVSVQFLTCPLQMVLRMAGFEHTAVSLPWLDNRQLQFRFV